MTLDLLPASMADRITVADNGCWLWTGYIDPSGYGRTHDARRYGNPQVGAHRVVYELLVGPIPPGLHLDHTCHDAAVCPGGNTCEHRRCVNPAHLEPVTPKVNNERSNSPSARQARRTHCVHGHPLPDKRIGRTQRRTCRECLRVVQRTSGRPVTGNVPPGIYTIGELCAAEGINKRDLWAAENSGRLPANVTRLHFAGRVVRFKVVAR